MEKVIHIKVENRIATTVDGVYVCGNSDYVVEFAFDSEWAEHPVRTARFEFKDVCIDVVMDGDRCQMPRFIGADVIRVGVYAGDLRVSTVALVFTMRSILCDNGTPAAPPEDIYAQIMAAVNAVAAEIRCRGSERETEAVSNNGKTYTAKLDGITSLYKGLAFTIVPNRVSTSTAPTLNLNGLGAKQIRLPAGTTNSAYYAAREDFLAAGYPVVVQYNGQYWIATSVSMSTAGAFSGVLLPKNGGTGQDSLTAGRYLVGNGTNAVKLLSASQVLEDIGAIGYRAAVYGAGAASSYDANTFTTSGIWRFAIWSSYDPVEKCHVPAAKGILIVYAAYEYIWQEFLDLTAFVKHFRGSLDGGTSWSDWKKMSETSTDATSAVLGIAVLGSMKLA